jgi:hypothetical protein
LDDADPPGLRDGRDQLGVAARVHGAAHERHLDARPAREGSRGNGATR